MSVSDEHLLNRRTWIRGSAWLVSGNGVSLALTIISGVLLARTLGPSAFGVYSALAVAVGFGGTLATFRLDMHLVAVLRPGVMSGPPIKRCMSASAALTVGVCAAGLVGGIVLTRVSTILLVLAAIEVAFSPLLLLRAVLQSRARQDILASASVLNRLAWVVLIAGIVVIRPAWSLEAVMAARVLVTGVEAAVLVHGLATPLRDVLPQRLAWPMVEVSVLRSAAPLAIAGFAGTAYNRSDQLLLAGMRGRTETGVYAAGVRLADMLLFLGSIVQNVTLPGLVVLVARDDRDGVRRAVSDTMLATAVPAGLGAAVMLATRGRAVTWIFGPAYHASESIAVILSVGAWVAVIGTTLSSVAMAMEARRLLLAATVGGLIVNVALNVVLIPPYGAPAAAWTSVVAYSSACLILIFHAGLREAARGAVRATASSAVAMALAGSIGLMFDAALLIVVTSVAVYLMVTVAWHRNDLARALRSGRRFLRPRLSSSN